MKAEPQHFFIKTLFILSILLNKTLFILLGVETYQVCERWTETGTD